jgi:hypothetical protein
VCGRSCLDIPQSNGAVSIDFSPVHVVLKGSSLLQQVQAHYFHLLTLSELLKIQISAEKHRQTTTDRNNAAKGT